MPAGVVLYQGWYSALLCHSCPDLIFVFGDNLLGFGKGGQAIIRDCPNAFGVPTKRKPAMTPGSFFAENNEDDLDAVLGRLSTLWKLLGDGEVVVIPVTENGDPSLGLERARLKEKAPTIYEAIQRHVGEMAEAYGSIEVASEDDLVRFAQRSIE
jgi:hypothetical protein